ncbi:hypothetical protein IFO70_09100 [Phormidium tenue FACHB-886]|nr:hypothetical protein [Phormidium tenue FACHB-886]
MKVALQNPFFGQLVAETELAQRIALAAQNLGWETVELQTAAQVNAFQPDFVIALHNNSPKLAAFPTYGCLWNPLSFFEGTEQYVKHVLTYDGYLTSSGAVDRWLHQILYTTPKTFFTAPFYTSCPKTPYQPPNLDPPRLMYLGSNWDGSRFPELFEGLDAKEYMTIYGNPDGWTHLKQSYRGALPYDGTTVLQTLNQTGVGLCLHRAEHRYYGLPSMRIFEIVASGAVAICGDHPFIRDRFGESVLYLDPDANPSEQVDRISTLMHWIQANPQAALAKSAQAHQIFLEHFALEKLLLDLVPHHETVLRQKGFVSVAEKPASTVQWILPYSGKDGASLQQRQAQVARQSYGNQASNHAGNHAGNQPIVVASEPVDLEGDFQLVQTPASAQSSFLWAGLNAVSADYFAVLDEAAILHPNHLQRLVSLLDRHPDYGVAYSGCLYENEAIQFQLFNLEQLLTFELAIPLSSIVVRRSVLDATLLQDPQLREYGDLCLLFLLAQRTKFLFSYELTCELQTSPPDHHLLLKQIQNWSSELSRLKFIFWHQEFTSGKTLQTIQKNYREHSQLHTQAQRLRSQLSQSQTTASQLQEQVKTAQAQIEAMRTSKFWKLRSAWFKMKKTIGLPTDPE